MMLGLSFLAPWLLAGLLAMGIPLALHLLARSRAQEVLFPTLRFLKLSMAKTARRRRIQHMFLMLLRMLLLGLLALAVAEPVTRTVGGWMRGKDYACVIILDNSMSMRARQGAAGDDQGFQTRLDRAKAEAKAMLSGDDKPALAAILATNGPQTMDELHGSLDVVREAIDRVSPAYERAPLAQRVAAAIEMLRHQSLPQKSITIFSDLQEVSFGELARLDALSKAQDVHLLIVNTAPRQANNVGVTDVRIEGRLVVGQVLSVAATLVNSSPTDRVVDVGLRVNGSPVGQKIRQSLRPAGQAGGTAVVRFRYPLDAEGAVTGEVVLDQQDDLLEDNWRRFNLRVGRQVRALVVRGPVDDPRQPISDPAMMLVLVLDPYTDRSVPWSIAPQAIGAERFTPDSLAGKDVAFFCDVPSFTPPQARAIEEFASGGGSVVFFLGPNVDVDNYNDSLVRRAGGGAGLLPAPLGAAVGEVGPTAEALFINWVDFEHPYLKGLYDNLSEVKADVRGFVQRYYPLGESDQPPVHLVRLDNGDPLVVYKKFGLGRVVLCTTGTAHRWSNLAASPLMLSMALRVCLTARGEDVPPDGYLAGGPVSITPRVAASDVNMLHVLITPPADGGAKEANCLAVRMPEGHYLATFTGTEQVGVYQWRLAPGEPEATGAFVVNPQGLESDLRAVPADTLARSLRDAGLPHAYVGPSVAAVQQAALADARPRNWWDMLLALTVVVLVTEAVVANRFRKPLESVIPAYLNPRLAS